jgi:hypothetical protein
MQLILVKNSHGSAMVLALMILALLSVIGVSAINTSTMEQGIATNDGLYKIAFYSADGGTEVGHEILEQEIGVAGFTEVNPGAGTVVDNVKVVHVNFYQNTAATAPSDTNRDVFFPANYGTGPHTNLTIGGNSVLSTGSGLQMAAGYQSKGKGLGGGGAYIIYNIFSQYVGNRNSQSTVRIHYRHVLGQEGG